MQNEGESTGDEKRNKQKFAKASTQNMHKNAEKCGCGDSHRNVESALSMLRHQSWSNYSCRAPGSVWSTTHANKLRLLQGETEGKPDGRPPHVECRFLSIASSTPSRDAVSPRHSRSRAIHAATPTMW